jgi:hypothetical protein
MSTKNLSRTVIEGGRRPANRDARRQSNADERTWERVTSHKLLTASELDEVIYRPRRKIYRDFSDKLAPAGRFLATQVGRAWSKVAGELLARFDTRTTAGRHIVFDHVLPSVRQGYGLSSRYRFFVDAHGVLRAEQRRRKPRKPRTTW